MSVKVSSTCGDALMKKILMNKPLAKMAGLMLLEIIFALAISAMVLMGAIIYFASVKQNANINKAVGDMNAIIGAYYNFMTAGNTLTSGTKIPQLQGYLPSPLYDPWGEEYSLTVDPNAKTIRIGIGGIAGKYDKNCNAIASLAGATSKDSNPANDSTSGQCFFMYTL